jgi:hypothetical protein
MVSSSVAIFTLAPMVVELVTMEQHTIDTYAEKQLSYAATDF